jgi:hypothetical protein
MPRFGQIAGPGQDRFLTPTLFVLGDKSEYIAANLRDQAKDIAKDLSPSLNIGHVLGALASIGSTSHPVPPVSVPVTQ